MRARYKGQLAGDERRLASDVFAERLSDNEIVEGTEVKKLKQLYVLGNWTALTRYTEELRTTGWSNTRIQSLLSRAMVKTRIPKK